MPKTLDGVTYYSPHEAAEAVGISKPTLLRWIKQRVVKDSARRDRNGWRIFSEKEVDALRKIAQAPKGT